MMTLEEIERIALAQINTTVGDFSGNLKKILTFAGRAGEQGADLVCFPELTLCGYPPRDLLFRSSFLEANQQALEELKSKITDLSLIVGYAAENTGGKGKPVCNRAVWLENGEIIWEYSKNLLPTYDVFDEARHFESGRPPQVKRNFVLTICEDLWNVSELESDFLSRDYDLQPLEAIDSSKLETIVNISASPFVRRKNKFRRKLFSHLAQKYSASLLFCNQVGGNDSLVFDGNSAVFNRAGEMVEKAAAFSEDLLVFERKKLNSSRGSSRAIVEEPAVESEAASIYEALKLGLQDYMKKCNFDRVLLGLSGGIDSSITACIAADALGSENVLGVLMPSRISSEESVLHAQELAENLAIKTKKYQIQDLFEGYLDLFADDFAETEWGTTEENLQARVRGNILMALSNKFGRLLISTGNKSELAVGYCTLYGDMTGGLALISDVPKTMVYKLAEYRNEINPVVPRAVIEKPPSAELSPEQEDQDVLPPYEVLDAIIEAYVEKHNSIREIVAAGYEEELVEDVVRMIDYNEYKRQQAPIGLKVTSKSFGAGWEMPIAQRFIP